ncbi:MAG: pyridoxal phosphate-dependent aminotransferase [Methanomassiliicoccales archaeon]|nr:MAG: pyridoxal phosphate-dependent aminotransferase [Methanomassiliicoccales archaeon]
MFADRMSRIAPSGTMATADLVEKLKKEGIDIVSFALGEPDFDTPEHIVKAAISALNQGFTHYTPTQGIPELREAIAKKSKEENDISCDASNVIVTPTKLGIFASVLALSGKGDEVILPDPGFVSYFQMINFAGAKAVGVRTLKDNGFRMLPDDVAEAINPKTKVIILNSPGNPTGCVATKDDMKGIADLAQDHGLFVITDEIYEKIIYKGEHHSIAALDNMFERTVTLNGFSKSYAMTGWRLGWVLASKEIVKEIQKIQQHSISCAVSFAQKAGVAALKGPQESVKKMVSELRERRDIMVKGINSISKLECNAPQGAFYVFAEFNYDKPSVEFAKFLIENAHVAITPGSSFGSGGEGFIRFSFATSQESIDEGLKRIENALAKL